MDSDIGMEFGDGGLDRTSVGMDPFGSNVGDNLKGSNDGGRRSWRCENNGLTLGSRL